MGADHKDCLKRFPVLIKVFVSFWYIFKLPGYAFNPLDIWIITAIYDLTVSRDSLVWIEACHVMYLTTAIYVWICFHVTFSTVAYTYCYILHGSDTDIQWYSTVAIWHGLSLSPYDLWMLLAKRYFSSVWQGVENNIMLSSTRIWVMFYEQDEKFKQLFSLHSLFMLVCS